MNFLNKFLYSLITNPIIKSSQIFYEFLSLDENAYAAKKKEYAKSIKAPVKISEFKNLEGTVLTCYLYDIFTFKYNFHLMTNIPS